MTVSLLSKARQRKARSGASPLANRLVEEAAIERLRSAAEELREAAEEVDGSFQWDNTFTTAYIFKRAAIEMLKPVARELVQRRGYKSAMRVWQRIARSAVPVRGHEIEWARMDCALKAIASLLEYSGYPYTRSCARRELRRMNVPWEVFAESEQPPEEYPATGGDGRAP